MLYAMVTTHLRTPYGVFSFSNIVRFEGAPTVPSGDWNSRTGTTTVYKLFFVHPSYGANIS